MMQACYYDTAVRIDSVPQTVRESIKVRASHIINNLAMR